MRKQSLHLYGFFFFFFFFGWCLSFALKLHFWKRDRKTDIQGIKAFFTRPSTHYGYCQEIIPNTHSESVRSHKGKGSGHCQRWPVCFEAGRVLFLMRHSCSSPTVCHKRARHLRASQFFHKHHLEGREHFMLVWGLAPLLGKKKGLRA